MKKVLIILGHPNKNSFCGALADQYIKGAQKAGHEVKTLNIGDLEFNPILRDGYNNMPALEPDLKHSQQMIKWATHCLIVFPTRWTAPPALLKGFLERVLLPDFAYKYIKGKKPIPYIPLLKDKTADIIATMDSPNLFYRFIIGGTGNKIIKDSLKFCGIKIKNNCFFGSIKMSSDSKKSKWLKKAFTMGERI